MTLILRTPDPARRVLAVAEKRVGAKPGRVDAAAAVLDAAPKVQLHTAVRQWSGQSPSKFPPKGRKARLPERARRAVAGASEQSVKGYVKALDRVVLNVGAVGEMWNESASLDERLAASGKVDSGRAKSASLDERRLPRRWWQ